MSRKEVTVTWLNDLTFDAQLGRHHLMLDSAASPETARGPSPVQLVLAGVAGCTAMDVVSILRKARQPFTSVAVRAEGESAADHPRRFTHVTLVYEVRGPGVDPAVVARAVQLSEERYCSVSATLRERVMVSTRIELPDAEVEPEAAARAPEPAV
jgi:putative redox protein